MVQFTSSLCYSATFVLAVILSCHGPLIGSNAQNPATTASTTTAKPPTTTTTSAPPTPKPTPTCQFVDTKPTVDVQKFVINKANSTDVCLVAKFAVLIEINQTTDANGTKVTKKVYLNLGQGKVNAAQSLCDTNQNVLAIEYTCGQLSFTVKSNSTISVNDIHGVYHHGVNPVKDVTFNYHASSAESILFPTQPGFHYSCTSEQTVMVTGDNGPVGLTLSNIELEAFRDGNTSDSFFRPVQECSLDAKQTNDLVPIAVGACLAALVVIVLIAYFVGRRRLSERSTYESV